MSLTLLGWLPVACTIAISALLIFPQRSRGSRREQLGPETGKAPLEDSGAQLKLVNHNQAEAGAARPALLSRLRSSSWGFGQDLRGTAGALIVAAAVFLLVAGIGATVSYLGNPPEATGSRDTNSFSRSDGEMLARLEDYTRSIGIEQPASMAAAGKLLPDVNTMIERLAARLETTPEDIKGWRMLGWSYFHTARYQQAATAFARAAELDPNSAELKLSYEEAKAKASEIDNLETASSLQAETAGKGGDGPSVEKITKSEAMPPHERDAEIRSMVDRLADRLESSPRDIEGWTLLMRSRVVRGERDVAATAFRKALEVFKDDSAASGRISATAIELGLKAE
jgi:cytochrome c-type biogenesis protein CcmH/NrfG